MKRILVSGASGIVGYGILRSLRKLEQTCFLVGTSMYPDSVAPAFCDVFEQAPPTSSAEYLDWFLAALIGHKIDIVIPGIEVDMYRWVQSIPQILETGAVPLLNKTDLIALCKDKWAFYENLSQAHIPYAIESSLSSSYSVLCERFGLPFLIKPRQGFGSKGIVRVDCEETFSQYKSSMGTSLMAQPLVGTDDEEYTTSVFCDGVGGSNAAMTLRRRLSRDGFTEKAEAVSTDEFNSAIETLCKHFQPIGPTNFQFRKCPDGIKLLEINPRISSSTSIRAAFGFNESVMAVEYFLNGKMPMQPLIRRGKAVRFTEEFIFYEDSLYL